MTMYASRHRHALRSTALLVAASLAFPIFVTGCGGRNNNQNIPPPVDDTRGGAPAAPPTTQPRTGMSTGKKAVIVLAGAALLYYLYKHHQKQNGQDVQYYKSKNGRVYYRDPQTHQVHWVTPVAVPTSEAQDYSRYQGYNNQTAGDDYGSTAAP